MTIARAHLVDPSVAPWYHCVIRYVRRALLPGEGTTDRRGGNHKGQPLKSGQEPLPRTDLIEEIPNFTTGCRIAFPLHPAARLEAQICEAFGLAVDDF